MRVRRLVWLKKRMKKSFKKQWGEYDAWLRKRVCCAKAGTKSERGKERVGRQTKLLVQLTWLSFIPTRAAKSVNAIWPTLQASPMRDAKMILAAKGKPREKQSNGWLCDTKQKQLPVKLGSAIARFVPSFLSPHWWVIFFTNPTNYNTSQIQAASQMSAKLQQSSRDLASLVSWPFCRLVDNWSTQSTNTFARRFIISGFLCFYFSQPWQVQHTHKHTAMVIRKCLRSLLSIRPQLVIGAILAFFGCHKVALVNTTQAPSCNSSFRFTQQIAQQTPN